MWILAAGLVIMALFALLVGLLRERRIRPNAEEGVPETRLADGECCGQHEICEKESLLAAVSKQIEYYDDEELDRYRGMPSDSYTDEQTEAFREVFYTMQETDVAGWVRSLQLRGVELPDALKDEVFLVVGERRMSNKRP